MVHIYNKSIGIAKQISGLIPNEYLVIGTQITFDFGTNLLCSQYTNSPNSLDNGYDIPIMYSMVYQPEIYNELNVTCQIHSIGDNYITFFTKHNKVGYVLMKAILSDNKRIFKLD